MEGQVVSQPNPALNPPGVPPHAKDATGPSAKSPHLMCGVPLWGLAGFILAAYFCYRSYWHLANADYSWPHTLWTIVTYIIWIVVIGGLLSETRCRRERIFFGSVLITFLLGFGLSAWSRASDTAIHQFRIASTVLWAVAALASLTTISGPRKSTADEVRRD